MIGLPNARVVLGVFVVGMLAACASTQSAKNEDGSMPAATAPAATQSTASAAMSSDDHYTVARGDNLWDISSRPKIYGNPYEWPLLYRANREKIQDADLIYPGQVLAVQRNASAADINAAVQHARMRGAWRLGVAEQSDKAYLASSGKNLAAAK